MKKHFFPAFLDISEKHIVVVGGGSIATRRVRTLLEFASDITVVAPDISDGLRGLVIEQAVIWIKDEYKKEYLYNKDIVVAATSNPEVNHMVHNDSKALEKQCGKNMLVSIADDRNLCDFYFPSVVKMDDVVIGINSGGSSPRETKEVRKQIENILNSKSVYE